MSKSTAVIVKEEESNDSKALAVKKPNALQPASNSQIAKPRPKPKPKVIDEETYIESLDKIIQRDFFPDLPKLRTQLEWLEAESNHDIVKMREIYQRVKAGKIEGATTATPRSLETPTSFTPIPATPGFSQTLQASKRVEISKPNESDTNTLTLNQFQAKYTSEDNASFETIMEHHNIQKRQKLAYLYDKEKDSVLRLEDGTGSSVKGWKYSAKNLLMYNPDGAAFSASEEKQMALGPPKEISYDNTRIREPIVGSGDSVSNKINHNATNYELIPDERTYMLQKRAHKESKIDLDDLKGGKLTVPESPRIGGYNFVMTPSPAPDASPFTTWGTIEGTPLLLETSTPLRPSSGPSFKIPATPKRELLAHQLVDQSSKAKKLKTNAPNTPKSRQTQASPRSTGLDMQLRASYASPMTNRLTPNRPLASPRVVTPSPQSTPK